MRLLIMTRWLVFAFFVSALSFHASAAPTSKDVPIIVTHAGSAPSITVSNSTPAAGSTIQVSVNPGSNPGDSADFVTWSFGGTRSIGPFGDSFRDEDTGAANGPTSYTTTVPNEGSDYPVQYDLTYWNKGGQANFSGGCTNNGLCPVAQTSIIVPANIPPVSLTAMPPADVTSIPPGFATPGQIIKVGPPGTCGGPCDFSNVQDAVNQANTAGTDYAYIQVQGGHEYLGCWQAGAPGPRHWWFKGVGGAFPHLKPGPTCGGWLFQVNAAEVTIDNIELSDSTGVNNVGSVRNNSCASITLRNVYIHDGGTGILYPALNCNATPWTATVLNSLLRRNGGFNGPAHNTYFANAGYYPDNPGMPGTGSGGSGATLVVKRSVFEGALAGHALKSTAFHTGLDCNVLMESESEVHIGSTAALFEQEGGTAPQVTMTNNLIVQGPYWRNNVDAQGSPSNAFMMQWAVGAYAWPNDSWWVLKNNTVINDGTGTHGQAVDEGASQAFFRVGYPMKSPPYQWPNNTFIGPTGVPSGGVIPGLMSQSDSTVFAPTNGAKGNISDVDFGTPAPSASCPMAPGATACGYDTGTPNSIGNRFFSSRAQAAAHNWPSAGGPLADVVVDPVKGPTPYVTWPFDPIKYPMPSACTQPVGPVRVP